MLRAGSTAPYRAVAVVDGEPHIVRNDFGVAGAGPGGDPGAGPAPAAVAGRPLLCLVHLTDVQLADVQSPTRFEFLNRYFADPRYAEIIPVQRPQEALTAHAVDAMLRTVNALHGPATGAPLRLAVTTGDAIDNAQWNELQAFLTLLDGASSGRAPAAPATRESSRWAGRTASSGNRTVTARTGPTSTGASSDSRTTRACWSAPCASSTPMAWRSRGSPASATTRRSTRASAG